MKSHPTLNLIPGNKACTDYRKIISQHNVDIIIPTDVKATAEACASSDSNGGSGSVNRSHQFVTSDPNPPAVTVINEALAAIVETPIIPSKLKQKTYPHFKAKKIQRSLTSQIGLKTKSSDFDVMIDQMKTSSMSAQGVKNYNF